MPESELQGARELIDRFEAGLREAQPQSWDGNGEDGLQQVGRETVRCNVLAKAKLKKRRGRPRKRTTSPVGEHGNVASAVNASPGEMEEVVSDQGGDKSRIRGKG
jgi:hypothetical protein